MRMDPEVIEHGVAFARQHGTTLSRLVSDFLSALPLQASAHQVSLAVQRLLGAALPADGDARGAGTLDHHDHLATKYGSR